MYLYSTLPKETSKSKSAHDIYISKVIGQELNTSLLAKTQLKDTTSSKLNIKGPKQADAAHLAETRYLKKQLDAFPEGLREDARANYLLDQNIKRKDLQEYQCVMIGKLVSILRENLLHTGQDFRKFKIGGYDGGTYGKFSWFGVF